jgi:hypothetical protein
MCSWSNISSVNQEISHFYETRNFITYLAHENYTIFVPQRGLSEHINNRPVYKKW